MQVISFVTQKGGSGKTTLAFNTAVAAKQISRQRVLILDMDPQATAEAWYQDRDADTPKLVTLEAKDLDNALVLARQQGFDLVIIDTPGRDAPASAAAIRASDLCLIPCRPTPADMKALAPTVETVRRLGIPAAFVLTQTPPRSYRIREAQNALSIYGMVAPARTVIRNAYQDAQGSGLGVTEYEPDGKAAAEIRQIWSWTEAKLRKITDGQETNVA